MNKPGANRILFHALTDITKALDRDRLFETKGVAYGVSLFTCTIHSPTFPGECGKVKWLINELVKAKLKELNEIDLRRYNNV